MSNMRPDWIAKVKWLWEEDDATTRDPDHVTVERGWFETFGETYPGHYLKKDGAFLRDAEDCVIENDHWVEKWDAGDAVYFLDSSERVVCESYPGASAIGVVE